MSFQNNYSTLDRLFHRLAFSTRSVQQSLADLEDRLFKSRLDPVTPGAPVFVTGLPRAGTTLLLEMLETSGQFSAHTYEDMPFILTPMMWSKMAARFRKNIELQERAHGDGMMVSMESPEAFEEVLWASFWPKQYHQDHVDTWSPRLSYPEFERFFEQHIKKIVSLRSADLSAHRYLSKNNMNISRIGYIAKIFPDARIVIPFRHPFEQSASLLRQHTNFLAIHREDPFAKSYMRAIGHYDFGENLKPINMGGWQEKHSDVSPNALEFWLQYWIASYRFLLDNPYTAALFSYDQFCHQPKDSLQKLADWIELEASDAFLGQADRVSPPKPYSAKDYNVSKDLLDEATALFGELTAAAVNAS